MFWRRKDGDTSRYVSTTYLPELSVDAKCARVQVPCRHPNLKEEKMSQNAKQEILRHVEGREVEFVKIAISKDYGEEPLRIEGTWEEVLPKLDFNYDDGYGGKESFGFIWYADGTWSSRGEYDGSEWWEHHICPDRSIVIEVEEEV